MNSNSYLHTKELLVDAGLKATHPRIAVMHQLKIMDGHPSAEQVHFAIRENNPSISLGSVHRILEKLAETGLASKVASKNGMKRYDANLDAHSHIYAVNTDEIEDYFDDELNALVKEYFEKKQIDNFKITDIKVQINGKKRDPNEKVTIV